MSPVKGILGALSVLAILLLAACSDDDPRTGRLTLGVTDAPVDNASKVVVVFTGVEVKPQDGDAINFEYDAPRSIDLLALEGGGSEIILDNVEVPSGGYNWVRLQVTAEEDGELDSFIELDDGSQHELEIPSGAETGLKLVSGFGVPAGGAAAFTIDFDLRKSVHEPMDAADSYKLRPALRLVDNAQAGDIAGTVAPTLITLDCSPAVYVFSGAGATPDDVDGIPPEPVNTALVELNTDSGEFEYRAAFLAPGEYTAAFTCDAADDNPATDDAIAFTPGQSATVTANSTAAVNFGP